MARAPRLLGTFNSSSSSSAAAGPPGQVAGESDLVVILAALLCAVICVVGLIAVARCAWMRQHTASSSAATNKGLKKKVLQALPTFTYDGRAAAAAEQGGGGAECAICLAEYAEGDEIRVLPQCGHGFHAACVDTWLGSHSSCPSCRQILVVSTRCGKCGEFPAPVTAPADSTEAELKAREEAGGSSSGFLPF